MMLPQAVRRALCQHGAHSHSHPHSHSHSRMCEEEGCEGWVDGGAGEWEDEEEEDASDEGGEAQEGERTVGSDANVAVRDVVAGLIRMGLLPRLRCLLDSSPPSGVRLLCLQLLAAVARHSLPASLAVLHALDLLPATDSSHAPLPLPPSSSPSSRSPLEAMLMGGGAAAAHRDSSGGGGGNNGGVGNGGAVSPCRVEEDGREGAVTAATLHLLQVEEGGGEEGAGEGERDGRKECEGTVNGVNGVQCLPFLFAVCHLCVRVCRCAAAPALSLLATWHPLIGSTCRSTPSSLLSPHTSHAPLLPPPPPSPTHGCSPPLISPSPLVARQSSSAPSVSGECWFVTDLPPQLSTPTSLRSRLCSHRPKPC